MHNLRAQTRLAGWRWSACLSCLFALVLPSISARGQPPDVPCEQLEEVLVTDTGWNYEVVPGTLLWTLPLANQREPRLAGRLVSQDDTMDAWVGAQVGLVRVNPSGVPNEGLQLDAFGAAFTRFFVSDLTAIDFRGGIGPTLRHGSWEAKLLYEHMSSHIGDEFLDDHPNFNHRKVTRDELVLGLAHRFFEDYLRIYGQLGTQVLKRRSKNGRARLDLGVEWANPNPTGPLGSPFAALDVGVRPEQDHEPGLTVQVGWLWRNLTFGPDARVVLEFYTGRSPFGVFSPRDESWVAFMLAYDF
jgi:hypothetical protein